MSNKQPVIGTDDNVQAVIVADTFTDEFAPVTDETPFSLLPLLNRPLIDYTLEFLSLGGIDEVFLFCCFQTEAIKSYIASSIERGVEWSLTMKVNVIISESCHSFGDCLRDLDRKGLLRGNFILAEPGAISNIKLLPILKKHAETMRRDKGAAMTLVLQEAGGGTSPSEELLLARDQAGRVLFHRKLAQAPGRKVTFPLEIFLEHSCVSLHHNLRDAHVAVCSPSVLPLFSDNFDFQTKDDFVRGLLINEEILGSTVYCHVARGASFGGGVANWRLYQSISHELLRKWVHPVQPPASNRCLRDRSVVAANGKSWPRSASVRNSVVGGGVAIGEEVRVIDSFIFGNCKIEDGCIITHSIISFGCIAQKKCAITAGCVIGPGVTLPHNTFIENSVVQASRPEDCEEKDRLGPKAFRLKIGEDADELDGVLSRKLSRLHITDDLNETDDEKDGFSDSDDEELSYTQSPIPDDTKLFFTEVIDSLTRGFEDELQCVNLILEINSSRYAYNVTVKEVNFYVIKAILHMSLKLSNGSQYFSQFLRLLLYFAPILTNYIRNDDAMLDTLQAIEDVAITNENITDKWIMFVLKWFYDKDYINEDVILEWSRNLTPKSRLHTQVKPFTDWLEEAEEATSSDDD